MKAKLGVFSISIFFCLLISIQSLWALDATLPVFYPTDTGKNNIGIHPVWFVSGGDKNGHYYFNKDVICPVLQEENDKNNQFLVSHLVPYGCDDCQDF